MLGQTDGWKCGQIRWVGRVERGQIGWIGKVADGWKGLDGWKGARIGGLDGWKGGRMDNSNVDEYCWVDRWTSETEKNTVK